MAAAFKGASDSCPELALAELAAETRLLHQKAVNSWWTNMPQADGLCHFTA